MCVRVCLDMLVSVKYVYLCVCLCLRVCMCAYVYVCYNFYILISITEMNGERRNFTCINVLWKHIEGQLFMNE